MPNDARSPITTITTLALQITRKHPEAEGLARDILTAVAQVKEAPTPRSIGSLVPRPETTYLLYCPAEGGWHTGERHGRRWVSTVEVECDLHPTHGILVPGAPEE
jgi:hypothetical protein